MNRAREGVAEDHPSSADFVTTVESRTAQRAGSEGLEVIARDRQHAEPLAPSIPDEVVPGLGVVVEGRHHFKRRRVIAKDEKCAPVK